MRNGFGLSEPATQEALCEITPLRAPGPAGHGRLMRAPGALDRAEAAQAAGAQLSTGGHVAKEPLVPGNGAPPASEVWQRQRCS